MHSFNLPKDFLYRKMDYLSFKQHFVQIDAHFSTLLTPEFGVSEYQYCSIYVLQVRHK